MKKDYHFRADEEATGILEEVQRRGFNRSFWMNKAVKSHHRRQVWSFVKRADSRGKAKQNRED